MDSSLSKYININLIVNNLSINCYREIIWSCNKYKISDSEFIMKSFKKHFLKAVFISSFTFECFYCLVKTNKYNMCRIIWSTLYKLFKDELYWKKLVTITFLDWAEAFFLGLGKVCFFLSSLKDSISKKLRWQHLLLILSTILYCKAI